MFFAFISTYGPTKRMLKKSISEMWRNVWQWILHITLFVIIILRAIYFCCFKFLNSKISIDKYIKIYN